MVAEWRNGRTLTTMQRSMSDSSRSPPIAADPNRASLNWGPYEATTWEIVSSRFWRAFVVADVGSEAWVRTKSTEQLCQYVCEHSIILRDLVLAVQD